jgi:hypothetical protein
MSDDTQSSSRSSRDVSISTYVPHFPKTSFRKLYDAGSRIALHYQMVGLAPPSSHSSQKRKTELSVSASVSHNTHRDKRRDADLFFVKTYYHYE